MTEQRKLAAILAADMVGYSRLMEADESGTIARQKTLRNEVIDPELAAREGRIVKTTGDGLLVEFPSVVEAVKFATNVQRAMVVREEKVPENKRIQYRIGINLGDIIIDGDDILGDGVNIAARLESLALPGGICISRSVFNQVKSKLELGFEELGPTKVKNLSEPVIAFRVLLDPADADKLTRAKHTSIILNRVVGGIAACLIVLLVGSIVWWQPWTTSGTGPKSTIESETLKIDRPSLAVLPFINMSGDKEQEYFSDGLTGDLITDLSRISGLTVISRTSTFAYKGQSTDVRTIGKELGARYIVEGSVRKSGGQIRINTQLINAKTGDHIWADRFDRDASELFDLQDEVRHKIVQSLKVKLNSREKRWLSRRLTDSPEAYDLYLRGLQQESYFTKEGNLRAKDLFQLAIELDPKFSAAYAHLAQAYSLAAEIGWTERVDEYRKKALDLAEKAVELDDELPQAHWSLARIYTRAPLRDAKRAKTALRRAIELNPNYADGYAFLASTLNAGGRAEEALSMIEKAMRINPRFPFWYYFELGRAQYFIGRYEAAAEYFKKAIERNPTVPWPHRWLAATYGHLGNSDDAEWEIAELEGMGQNMTIKHLNSVTTIRYPSYLKLYLEGLRKAGVPEE